MSEPLLEVEGLTKQFTTHGIGRRSVVRLAVDNVTFSIAPGEILGLVGESGSGKSTVARCVMQLTTPTSGLVRFRGRDVATNRRSARKIVRRGMQMVFQDPYASLDPRMRVGDIIAEGMRIHHTPPTASAQRDRVHELAALVGLRSDQLDRRPAHFSGGERQRIGIARALAIGPALLICDEPVASLDVSIQAQVLNLFKRLQRDFGLAMLFIAHDLATVRYLCDRIAVMHEGRIVEVGTRSEIYDNPRDAYTRELLAAVPLPDPIRERERRDLRQSHPI